MEQEKDKSNTRTNGEFAVQKAENKFYGWLVPALIGAIFILLGFILTNVLLFNDAVARADITKLQTEQIINYTDLVILNGNVVSICKSLNILCIEIPKNQ